MTATATTPQAERLPYKAQPIVAYRFGCRGEGFVLKQRLRVWQPQAS